MYNAGADCLWRAIDIPAGATQPDIPGIAERLGDATAAFRSGLHRGDFGLARRAIST